MALELEGRESAEDDWYSDIGRVVLMQHLILIGMLWLNISRAIGWGDNLIDIKLLESCRDRFGMHVEGTIEKVEASFDEVVSEHTE